MPAVQQPTIVTLIGADSAVYLVQAWAESFHQRNQDIQINVSGGGSGIGIMALTNGTADIATTSRLPEPLENEKYVTEHGLQPKSSIVAYDTICIFVHRENSLAFLTLDQLKDIFQEGGKTDTGRNWACRSWAQ